GWISSVSISRPTRTHASPLAAPTRTATTDPSASGPRSSSDTIHRNVVMPLSLPASASTRVVSRPQLLDPTSWLYYRSVDGSPRCSVSAHPSMDVAVPQPELRRRGAQPLPI